MRNKKKQRISTIQKHEKQTKFESHLELIYASSDSAAILLSVSQSLACVALSGGEVLFLVRESTRIPESTALT